MEEELRRILEKRGFRNLWAAIGLGLVACGYTYHFFSSDDVGSAVFNQVWRGVVMLIVWNLTFLSAVTYQETKFLCKILDRIEGRAKGSENSRAEEP